MEELKVISDRHSTGRQGKTHERILSDGLHTLKAVVYSDFYEFQSHGKCYRWDGRAWQQICDIPYSQIPSAGKGINADEYSLEETADSLFALAWAILGIDKPQIIMKRTRTGEEGGE